MKANNPVITRREFVKLSTIAATAACSAGLGVKLSWASTPTKGGVLRLGLDGGSTSGDTLNPARLVGVFSNVTSRQVYNSLVVVDDNGQAVPELAESWEARDKNREWIFNLRRGVEFHNGKTLTANDVIYSLGIHTGKDSKSAYRNMMKTIAEMKALDNNRVLIKLSGPNPDFQYVLADWHTAIVPENFVDYSKAVGTGPFTLKLFKPGIKSELKRNPNYWKNGLPYVDEVINLVINNGTARTAALRNGDVDAIDNVDFKTAKLLARQPKVNIWETKGRQHFTFPMDARVKPFDDVNVALAVKHAFDRELFVNKILSGFGSLGNDHPIPKDDVFFNGGLAQRQYDPDKSRFYLKKAGYDKLDLEIFTSRTPYLQAVDACVLLSEKAKPGGLNIKVNHAPEDGYWKQVWLKKPWCAAFWGGRATADLMLTVCYSKESSWNETHWSNDKFDNLLLEARSTDDLALRKQIYGELQQMIHNQCPTVIPAYASYLDAGRENVKGWSPNPNFRMGDFRIAEKLWFAS